MYFNSLISNLSLSSKAKHKLSIIPSKYLLCVAGGASKDNHNSTSQNNINIYSNNTPSSQLPTTFQPSQPDRSPVSGYVAGNEHGARIGIKGDLNENFSISGKATTNYKQVVGYELMLEFHATFSL